MDAELKGKLILGLKICRSKKMKSTIRDTLLFQSNSFIDSAHAEQSVSTLLMVNHGTTSGNSIPNVVCSIAHHHHHISFSLLIFILLIISFLEILTAALFLTGGDFSFWCGCKFDIVIIPTAENNSASFTIIAVRKCQHALGEN